MYTDLIKLQTKERKKYYEETDTYHMLAVDARKTEWVKTIAAQNAIVVLEGISMYFKPEEMQHLLKALKEHFSTVKILMDCYTVRAAKASKYKNPVNDVGVTCVYGIDAPEIFENSTGMVFVKEHDITPVHMINQLKNLERMAFKFIFGGKIAKGMYRMYEYQKK